MPQHHTPPPIPSKAEPDEVQEPETTAIQEDTCPIRQQLGDYLEKLETQINRNKAAVGWELEKQRRRDDTVPPLTWDEYVQLLRGYGDEVRYLRRSIELLERLHGKGDVRDRDTETLLSLNQQFRGIQLFWKIIQDRHDSHTLVQICGTSMEHDQEIVPKELAKSPEQA